MMIDVERLRQEMVDELKRDLEEAQLATCGEVDFELWANRLLDCGWCNVGPSRAREGGRS